MNTSAQALGDIALLQSFPVKAAHAQNAGKSSSLDNASHKLSPAKIQDIDKAAKDFEGMFVSEMLKPIFDSLSVNPVFGGGHGEEVMRSLMVQEYGKQIAQRGQFGLAASVKDALLKAQENATGDQSGAQQPIGSFLKEAL